MTNNKKPTWRQAIALARGGQPANSYPHPLHGVDDELQPQSNAGDAPTSQDWREHECSGTNIGITAEGRYYCSHCGWNDPRDERG